MWSWETLTDAHLVLYLVFLHWGSFSWCEPAAEHITEGLKLLLICSFLAAVCRWLRKRRAAALHPDKESFCPGSSVSERAPPTAINSTSDRSVAKKKRKRKEKENQFGASQTTRGPLKGASCAGYHDDAAGEEEGVVGKMESYSHSNSLPQREACKQEETNNPTALLFPTALKLTTAITNTLDESLDQKLIYSDS